MRCSRTESDCVRYLGDMRKSIGIVLRRCSLISEPEGCKMLLEGVQSLKLVFVFCFFHTDSLTQDTWTQPLSQLEQIHAMN